MVSLDVPAVLRKHKTVVLSLICFFFGIVADRELLPYSRTTGHPNGDVALAPLAAASLRSRNDLSSYRLKEIDTDVANDDSPANKTVVTPVTIDSDDKASVIFFHVHIMKTAGSSLNRYLARRYHAVCGHKGYSHDQPFHIGKPRMDEPGGFGPDRVRFIDMEERGWHNCRLISHETDSGYTIRILKELKKEGFKVRTLVPCRDPVSHCISKLSHVHFNLAQILNNNALCSVINTACSQIQSNRFSEEILSVADESSFFWYTNFSHVDDLISDYVPGRFFQLPEADRKFEMNKPFADDVVSDVIKKCGRTMHSFFMKKPYYQQCSRRIAQVDRIPQ